jgi:hypothetical protein
MTIYEIVRKVLREKNIYPPSVQDSHYGDKAIMTRGEIIEKTLKEMSLRLPSKKAAQAGDQADFLSGVITELQRRLPFGNIKTCGAFKYLNTACCDTCHTTFPQYEMTPVDLPDGGKAWVCENIELAIFPEQYTEFMERARTSPSLSKIFSDVARMED